MTSTTSAPVLAAMILLAGCAPVPRIVASSPRDLSSYTATRTIESAALPPAGDERGIPPAGEWWKDYADPQLTGVIEEGLKGAPDIAAAQARLKNAQAVTDQAAAALLPSLNAEGEANSSKQSYNNGVPPAFVQKGWNDGGRLAANLGFDPDLWGKKRAARRAAQADTAAARLEVEQARLVLSTSIAAAYADLAGLYARRDAQQGALGLREQSGTLVSHRVKIGLDTQGELKQASAAIPAARADLAATDEAIALTRNRIAALMGQGPDRGLAITRPAATIGPRPLPPGATTELLGRRPDVAAARAKVEAAAARVKAARADFYPSVSISGLIGLQSLGLSNLFKSGSNYGNASAAVSLPIFRGGELAGRYRGAAADYDLSVALYDRTVTGAFQELADAVTSRAMLATRLSESRQALADIEAAYGIARKRYDGGLADYLTVLTAEDTVLRNRLTVADLEARAFALDVALVRALGGAPSPQLALPGHQRNQSTDTQHD